MKQLASSMLVVIFILSSGWQLAAETTIEPKTPVGQPLFFYNNNANTAPPKTPLEALPTKLYTLALKTSIPEQIKNSLNNLFPELKIAVDSRTRTLAFACDKKTNQQIQELIKKLDTELPQIKFSVKIIEINCQVFDDYRSLFADLTSGFKIGYNFQTNTLSPPANFEGTLTSLVKNGQAKVIAQPTISMIDNHKASIDIGDKYPYVTTTAYENTRTQQIHQVDTGINLEITPQIVSFNLVLVNIQAAIATIKLWQELDGIKYPVLSTRKAQTAVYLPDRQTLVIAGLLDEEIKDNTSAIPLLSDLPLVGSFFRSSSKEKVQTDILFMITPEISAPGP